MSVSNTDLVAKYGAWLAGADEEEWEPLEPPDPDPKLDRIFWRLLLQSVEQHREVHSRTRRDRTPASKNRY
jgi:hypothetical protein